MPTVKQKIVFGKLIENARSEHPKSLGAILLDSGYGKGPSIMPSRVLNSKGMQELLEKAGVTDEKIANLLNEGLEAKAYVKTERVEGVGKGRLKTEEIMEVTDHSTRHRYLETAIKLKGHDKTVAPPPTGDTYNTFINQTNIDPNSPTARKLVDNTLDVLMQNTKRTVNVPNSQEADK